MANKGSEMPATRSFASEDNATGKKPPTSYLDTLMHLLKGYVGTGIFAMGDGFKNSGYIMGPCLLVIISIINLHCQHQLVKCAKRIADFEEEDVRPNYGETVHYTFLEGSAWMQRNAERLGVFTNIILYIAELGFCCVYFLFIAEHLRQVASTHGWDVSIYIWLAIVFVPMWLSTLLSSLKVLAPLSIVANLLIWLSTIIVYYFTVQGLPAIQERQAIAEISRIPLFFGTALFAFEGITFILQLRNEMEHMDQFESCFGVLNVGIVIVAVLYMSVGFLSYWRFGDDIKGSVFLNMDNDNVLAQVTKCIMALAILITFTLHMYIPFEITYPMIYGKWGPFKHPTIMILVWKWVPVVVTFALANLVPFLHLFISLIGASCVSILALIIPPILEFVAFRGELGFMTIVKNILIILVGVIGFILGTVLSMIDIIAAFKKEYD